MAAGCLMPGATKKVRVLYDQERAFSRLLDLFLHTERLAFVWPSSVPDWRLTPTHCLFEYSNPNATRSN
jgi:hypothetical protein